MTSEERKELRYLRRKEKREQKRKLLYSPYDGFDTVFSFRHLYLSGKRCAKGVYWKNSTQRYIGNLIPNTAKAYRGMHDGTFEHKGFHEFDLLERGKKRHIKSVHISERVIQKCLCDYCLVPLYSPSFIYDNSASIKKKGMDFALRRLVRHLEWHYKHYGLEGGILLYDFHSYFDTAPHKPLFEESAKRIHDVRLQVVADSFIKDFGEVGIGLGSQVSQTNALALPSPIDHFFKEVLDVHCYARYMDDGYAMSNDLTYLEACLPLLEAKCNEVGITLNLKKTKVVPIKDGFKWLKTKFKVTENGKVLIKMSRETTPIVRRKLRSFRKWIVTGRITYPEIRCCFDSYLGHMMRGNSFLIMEKTKHYFKTLFGFYPNKKGWEYMLSIIKDGNVLATVNTPTYVKLHENGSYVLCPEAEAEGVVVDGVVFHIIGRPAMEGTEDVFLEETDETLYQVKSKEERDAKTTELEDAIADLTMLIASTMM